MIDLHCHILPNIDDGAEDLAVSIEMAQLFVRDGVQFVACTPHILPGLYHNTGPQIRTAIAALQQHLDDNDIPLRLLSGADVHIAPNLATGLQQGQVLALADSRYVLIEPPHHVAPQRFDEVLFELMAAGYVPILTHPERLAWIEPHYEKFRSLVHAGVWMQITAGALTGGFGRRAHYWAERMLDDGLVHILASDAHDPIRRPPNLGAGRAAAAKRVGDLEADHLVLTRPWGIVQNVAPDQLPKPGGRVGTVGGVKGHVAGGKFVAGDGDAVPAGGSGGVARRLRQLFG